MTPRQFRYGCDEPPLFIGFDFNLERTPITERSYRFPAAGGWAHCHGVGRVNRIAFTRFRHLVLPISRRIRVTTRSNGILTADAAITSFYDQFSAALSVQGLPSRFNRFALRFVDTASASGVISFLRPAVRFAVNRSISSFTTHVVDCTLSIAFSNQAQSRQSLMQATRR